MRLAPEGIPFIVAALVAAAVLAVGARALQAWAAPLGPVLTGLAVVAGLFGVFCLWFFRDPAPTLPADPRAIVSPAEGRVIEVVQQDEPTYLGGPSTRITIFLSVFNVHVQRAPADGVVEHRSYKPGLYLVAWEPKASEANEQASLGIRTPAGPMLVRQIAGLIARRILTDPEEGDRVQRGARIGLIRFGSRVDLFLPPDWPVTVEVGQKVRVGETVVARIPDGAGGTP